MKILVSSLEPSANLHLGCILKNLENYELKGIFDPKFGKPLLASSEFSAMGFVEVLPLIVKAKRAHKGKNYLLYLATSLGVEEKKSKKSRSILW